MPLLAHIPLPAFARLAAEGVPVTPPAAWDGPVLRVGLINTMADGALEATERQFLRLLAAGAPGHGIELYPCGLPEIPRGEAARHHCAAHYLDLDALRAAQPAALIVTGANIPDPDLDRLFYRDSLAGIIAWAWAEVPTTLFSCLATHAVLHFRYGKPRHLLPAKRWGVYPHRIVAAGHPLVRGLNGGLVVPHSRWNDVPAADFAAAGLDVLVVDGTDGGVHLAATPDRRQVFMQGHPEYDPVSLLKEHRREVERFAAGDRPELPEVPAGIARAPGLARLTAHGEAVRAARRGGTPPLPYPQHEVRPHLHDTWRRDTETFFAAWLAAATGGTP
ncbi:MAG: homoserine O-succinyltransferase [Candidatus Krumholzibacteriia bacterium]